jgi:outer membrane protein OmpA-like peptidoglycan-associated protein
MRRIALFLSLLVAFACRKPEQPAPVTASATTTTATGTAAATATQSTLPGQDAEDLLGLAQGALVVRLPEALETSHQAYFMFDEDTHSTWTSADGKTSNQSIVVQLPGRGAIDRLQFDTENSELETRSPKNVKVELSDTSADDGFKPIAAAALAPKKDGQVVQADGSVQGRFVRITFVDNQGGPFIEVSEVRAFGRKLDAAPLASLTGTYKSEFLGTVNLKQEGGQVTGCWEYGTAPIVGGIEGHVVKFNFERDVEKGPAIMVFSADGNDFFGGYWRANGVSEHPTMTPFSGKRAGNTPAACPQSAQQEMTAALEKDKRLRLYGINFDSDSDHLKDDSKPTLDLVVAILKGHAGWKVAIEGHTDSTSTPEHNQQLSEARANAVKTYLTGAGIDAGRLATKGLGSTQPVASNDTALGRAANRRVELARE